MKAYKVWVDGTDKGCSVVWAENAGKAKAIAKYTDACEDEPYIEIRANRMPKIDKLYKGQQIGDWFDMELRKALVEEYGWECLEPRKEDCKECHLCEGKR